MPKKDIESTLNNIMGMLKSIDLNISDMLTRINILENENNKIETKNSIYNYIKTPEDIKQYKKDVKQDTMCKFRPKIRCMQKSEIGVFDFPSGLPDGYTDIKDYYQNISDREEKGCEFCHFYRNNFEGATKAVKIDYSLLSC